MKRVGINRELVFLVEGAVQRSIPHAIVYSRPGFSPFSSVSHNHEAVDQYRCASCLCMKLQIRSSAISPFSLLIIMDPKALHSGILFVICIAIPLIIGMIGSVFTASNILTWYAALNKPVFTPPGWVFGPAWTILYILMGISLYLILQKGLDKPMVRQGVILFAVQLALNFLWSIVFFGMHAIFFALVVIILLFVLVLATSISFFRVSKPAGWLLIPYLCWLGFASVLNATIWILN